MRKEQYEYIEKNGIREILEQTIWWADHTKNKTICDTYLTKFCRRAYHDWRVIMLELIHYKSEMLGNKIKFEKGEIFQLEYYLNHNNFFTRICNIINLTFGDLEEYFYDKYPQFINHKTNEIQLEDKLIEIIKENNAKENRILKLEQYQASILDKLNILTEMIDELQTKK